MPKFLAKSQPTGGDKYMQVCLTDINCLSARKSRKKSNFKYRATTTRGLICGYTEKTNTVYFKPSNRYLLSMKGQNTQKDIRGMNLTIVVESVKFT